MIISTETLDARIRRNKEAIEGPTAKQAARMAAYRTSLIELARAAETAGNDDKAFEFDCEAMDIEGDLARYGFDLAGKRVRRG